MKFKSLIIIFTFIIFFSCIDNKKIQKSSKTFKISLRTEKSIGPFKRLLKPFGSSIDKPGKFVGIPENDKYIIQFLRFVSSSKLKRLLEENKISQSEFENFVQGVNAVSGIHKDQFFTVLDVNNNNDFSDDTYYAFNNTTKDSLKNNLLIRDSLAPLINIKFENLDTHNVIYKDSINIRVFPYEDYFTYNEVSEFTELQSQLQLVAQVNEYLTGQFTIQDSVFEIAIAQGLSGTIFVTRFKDSLFIPISDPKYFSQKVKDTFKIPESKIYISVDSIDIIKKNLSLRKIESDSVLYGYTQGQKLKNFKLSDVNNIRSTIKDLLKEKQYLLIDFWGTWCAPCLELTPNLIALEERFDDLAILGVAYNSKTNEIKEYLEKNKVNWLNISENRDFNPIVDGLKIRTFPTFILINSEMEIVYRGIGKNALNDIKDILISKSRKHIR